MTASGFTAVILAADRNRDDPLVQAAGASCKALVKIAGTPMLLRVIDALQASARIDRILLSGPERDQLDGNEALDALLRDGRIDWTAPHDSPSNSAWHAMQDLPADTRILLTTADHPLLTAEIVDHFLEQALASNADVAVGAIEYPAIQARFPNAKKTVTRFRDGSYCGCNLFAFMTPEARRVAAAWRRVEQQRKNPLRIISQLGWWSVLRYLLGRLTLDQALAQLSQRLSVTIRPVLLPFPEAAIDVDSIADQALVEDITGSDS